MTKEELLQNIAENIPLDGSGVITAANIREIADNTIDVITSNSGSTGLNGTVKRANGVYYYDMKPAISYIDSIGVDNKIYGFSESYDYDGDNNCIINQLDRYALLDQNGNIVYWLGNVGVSGINNHHFFVIEPVQGQDLPQSLTIFGINYNIEDVEDPSGEWDDPCDGGQ